MCSPKRNLLVMAGFAVAVAFLSASQDIVIDAWRVESLTADRQALGAAMIQSGYRIAMLVSGAGGLLIAAYVGWFAAYVTMAALLGVGIIVFLLAPEPKIAANKASVAEPSSSEALPRKAMVTTGILMVAAGAFSLCVPGLLKPLVTACALVSAFGAFAGKRNLALRSAQIVAWVTLIVIIWADFIGLVDANTPAMTIFRVIGGGGAASALAFIISGKLTGRGPFADFMRRPFWPVILLAIFGYKLGEAMAGVMSTPLYISLGFSLPEIAYASKVFGFFSIVTGALLGGLVATRFGIRWSLIVCGILQCVGNLFFVLQAVGGHRIGYLVLCVTAENLTGAMAGTALITYLSSLCSPAFTATQFALLSALASLGRTVVASSGGLLSEKIGWVHFFLLTSVVALPAILLIAWVGPRDDAGGGGGNSAP
jgi:MFS family permease